MARISLITWLRPPKYLRPGWFISIIVVSVVFLISLVLFPQLPPVIPLFYSLAAPSQHVVSKNWIWLFPSLLLCITLLHLIIVRAAKDYQPLLLLLFTWTTVGVQIFLAITIIRSILLVT